MYPNPHTEMCPWYDAAEMFGAPNVKWCETTLCSWISEPANTWSNLLYMVFAVIIIAQNGKDSRYELRWMGPAMFLMGLFSLVYHASNNYLTQLFDFIGMYLLVFWMLVINLRRAALIERSRQTPVFVAMSLIGTGLVHVLYLAEIKFQLIVAAAALGIVITEFLAQKVRKVPLINFGIGLGFLTVAQLASLADGTRLYCEPDSWLQGHAVWHILAAIGLFFAYQHYRHLLTTEDA